MPRFVTVGNDCRGLFFFQAAKLLKELDIKLRLSRNGKKANP